MSDFPKLRNLGYGRYEIVDSGFIVERETWDSVNIWRLMLDGTEVIWRATRRELLEAYVEYWDVGVSNDS